MVCEHLRPLEAALLASGAEVTYRGQAWSKTCREWVYFDVILDAAAIRRQFQLPPCVQLHENKDPRSGLERGFACETCKDAVMGRVQGARRWPARAAPRR